MDFHVADDNDDDEGNDSADNSDDYGPYTYLFI